MSDISLEKRGRVVNFVRKFKARKEKDAPKAYGVFSSLKDYVDTKKEGDSMIGEMKIT